MLQRSEMKRSSAPLKRSGFKTSEKVVGQAGMKVGGTLQRRAPIAQGGSSFEKKRQSTENGVVAPERPVYSTFGRKQKLVAPHDQSDPVPATKHVSLKPRSKLTSRPRSVTKCERDHMGRVAELGCILCRHLRLGATPAIVHHLRTGQGKMRAPNWLTLPLCPAHHQHSGYGVHDMGRRQFYERYGISEVGLLEHTLELLNVDLNDPRFAMPPDALTADLNDEPDIDDGHH
jgi:hypothetical protein